MKAIIRQIITIFISLMAVSAWCEEYSIYTPHPASSDDKTSSEKGILVKEIEVQKGDTLSGLSQKFSGKAMYYPQILLFNSIKNPNLIYSGDVIKVPVTQDASVVENMETPKTSKASKHKHASSHKSKVKIKPSEHSVKKTPIPVTKPLTAPTIELSLDDLKSLGSSQNNNKQSRKKHKIKVKKPKQNIPSNPIVTKAEPSDTVKNVSAIVETPEKQASTDGQQLFENAVKAYRKDDCVTALPLLDRYLADNSKSALAADASLYRAECYMKLSAQ